MQKKKEKKNTESCTCKQHFKGTVYVKIVYVCD